MLWKYLNMNHGTVIDYNIYIWKVCTVTVVKNKNVKNM